MSYTPPSTLERTAGGRNRLRTGYRIPVDTLRHPTRARAAAPKNVHHRLGAHTTLPFNSVTNRIYCPHNKSRNSVTISALISVDSFPNNSPK